jgi:hypothetical protein
MVSYEEVNLYLPLREKIKEFLNAASNKYCK